MASYKQLQKDLLITHNEKTLSFNPLLPPQPIINVDKIFSRLSNKWDHNIEKGRGVRMDCIFYIALK